MLLLGVDIETGADFGTPHEKNFITEIGAVLWDTEFNFPVEMLSRFLIPNVPISKDCVEYTGITNALCEKHGWANKLVKEEFKAMVNGADFIVAHNGNNFDRPIINHWMGKDMPFRPWIDTYEDVPYPKNCKNVNLMYLNGFHGFCNPYSHRAVFDVCAMLKVLSHYDINEVVKNTMSDKIVIQANVDFKDKQLAKDKAFSWQECNGKTYEKKWVKKIRKDDLDKVKKDCPFHIIVLEECINGNRKKVESPLPGDKPDPVY